MKLAKSSKTGVDNRVFPFTAKAQPTLTGHDFCHAVCSKKSDSGCQANSLPSLESKM
jgi:hypothetical protein